MTDQLAALIAFVDGVDELLARYRAKVDERNYWNGRCVPCGAELVDADLSADDAEAWGHYHWLHGPDYALINEPRASLDRHPGVPIWLPRKTRDDELRAVAQVYRDNFDHAPRAAVAKTFGYTPRTASRQIDRARTSGYLPPTTRGKKRV